MTLGASPKQIRKIVRKEGGYMSALGNAAGASDRYAVRVFLHSLRGGFSAMRVS